VPSRYNRSKATKVTATLRSFVQHPPAQVREPRLAALPGDELAVEDKPFRELPQLGEAGRHVPAAAASDAQAVLCRHDRAEPSHLSSKDQVEPEGSGPERASIGSGSRRSERPSEPLASG